MTRFVFNLWWISAILSLLAWLFPALIVIGLFMLVLPGLVLVFAPDLFIATTMLLMANLLFGRLPGTFRLVAYALFLGGLMALDTAAPWSLNRSLDQYWEDPTPNAAAGDANTRSIALLFARRYPDQGTPVTPGCHNLCKRLLTDHAVQRVLLGAPPATDQAVPLDLQLPVTSYRLEHRATCPVGTDPEADRGVEQFGAGTCLIAEPATLAASDLVIIRDSVSGGPYPQSGPWRFYTDRQPAERLCVYRIRADQPQLVMLRIRLRTDRFFTPLIIGLANGYGMESVRLGVLRWPRPTIDDDSPQAALIDEFLRHRFKLDINFLH